jgi:hypothetical protein
MAEEKEKAIEKGQEPKKRALKVEDELSEKDFEKVAGGYPPDTWTLLYTRNC